MLATVEVLPEDEFDAWLEERGTTQGGELRARARRRGRACARSATACRARAASRRGSPAPPSLADREDARSLVRNGRGEMPAVGTRLDRRPDRRARRLPRGEPAQWPVEPSPQLPAWQRGRVASWLVTTDHKRIGILYIGTSLLFFVLAGLMALVIRIQLMQEDVGLVGPDRYNELVTIHGTTMVFLVVVPLLAGFANYLVPLMIGARDVAFPRLNALSYWLFAFGGIVLMLSFFADGGAAKSGWTGYPPLSTQAGGDGPGPLDPLAAHPHRVLARGRDQLRRDDPQHAHARDDVDAHAALRVVDLRLRLDAARDPAGALGGARRCCCSTAASRSAAGT